MESDNAKMIRELRDNGQKGVTALYKESMHSIVLSQRPSVVLPHCIASGNLVDKYLKPAQRESACRIRRSSRT